MGTLERRLTDLEAARQTRMNRLPPDMTSIYEVLGVSNEIRGQALAEKCSIAQVLGLNRRDIETARGQHWEHLKAASKPWKAKTKG